MSPRSIGTALLLHALMLGVLAQGVPPSAPSMPGAGVVQAMLNVSSAPPSGSPARAAPLPAPQPPVPEPEPEFLPDTGLLVPRPPAEPVFEPPTERTDTHVLADPARDVAAAALHFPAQPSSDEQPAAAGDDGPASPDTPPLLLEPEWPRTVRLRYRGAVMVEVEVSEHGKALSAEVLQGTGDAGWDAAMRESFLTATYAPATADGKPVASRHRFRVTFR